MMKALYILLPFSLFMAFALSSCGSTSDHEEGHHHHNNPSEGERGYIELSQKQMDAVGITLGMPESRNIGASISATGRLDINPQDESVVAPLLPGRISRICVVAGQAVKAGQPIAYIDAPEIASMQQESKMAAREVETALMEVNRQEALAAQGAGIRKNLDNARAQLDASRLRLEGCREKLKSYGIVSASGNSYVVTAPISGVVTEVSATIGSFADIQSPVARIVNTTGIFCNLQLPEKNLANVKEGQSVSMKLTNNPATLLEGRVLSVNPALDPVTHTVSVKVSLNLGSDVPQLVPGMAVTALIASTDKPVSALPEGAIVNAGGKHYIFLMRGEEMEDGEKMFLFEKAEVATGSTSLGYTEFTPLTILPAEPRIVVSGAFYLNSMSTEHGEHSH